MLKGFLENIIKLIKNHFLLFIKVNLKKKKIITSIIYLIIIKKASSLIKSTLEFFYNLKIRRLINNINNKINNVIKI